MRYSPLRYPGGKAKLAPFMEMVIDKTGHRGGTYIEPFAGGAGIALELLFNEVVDHIVINDYDKAIASFWKAVLNENSRFIDCILNVPLSIEEWDKQRQILQNEKKCSFELGFATFYLNRTNRSGIISGGPIGGKSQDGLWKLDARFNRESLSERVENIGKRRKDISIYNKEAKSFILNYLPKYADDAIVYFDPPYFYKGKQLYMNYFTLADHERIGELITGGIKCDWIVTYDDAPEIVDIYQGCAVKRYDLHYSVAKKRTASELIIMSDEAKFPTKEDMISRKICVNLR